MNKIAGYITFPNSVSLSYENLYFVETSNQNGSFSYFIYGKTYFDYDHDVIQSLEKIAGIASIKSQISISNRDKIELFVEDEQVQGNYVTITVEGRNETFDSVYDQFGESSPYIVAIRESEPSKIFGNKILKVDIVN